MLCFDLWHLEKSLIMNSFGKDDYMKKIIYIGYYDTKNNEKENRNYVLFDIKSERNLK